MSIVKTVLQDGTKTAVVHWAFTSDGSDITNAGEMSGLVLLDPTADLTGVDNKIQLIITQVWYGFSWFDMSLAFDDITGNPLFILQLPRDAQNYMDLRYFGGLKDRTSTNVPSQAPNTQLGQPAPFPTPSQDVVFTSRTPTGKILATTNGYAQLGSQGHLILEVKKNQMYGTV